ncbi:MAG: acyl-CoA dehydrogenase family protein [Fimbriimonas sp.]
MSEREVLNQALAYLREEVAPRAQEIDRDIEAVRWAVQGLCDRNLMALKRPAEFGGPELPEPLFREFQEECARTSGSLSFLQTQHQSAVSMIARGENTGLAEEYLPQMADGSKLVGIGFSQLRRPGPPIMRAERVDEGYVLDGKVPWVTGWSFYPEFLIGATLPDGQALFAIVPLPTTEVDGIAVSEPMKLAAMETALTVSVEFSRFLVRHDRVAFIRPTGWIQNSDMINIALQGHFALGCAQAGLDIIAKNAEAKPLPFLREAYDRLAAELLACRRATADAQTVSEETTQERLNVRAWAIDLAVRCAHAAITSSSGAANSLDHPAQRVYREALVYTVSAQTSPIMEATLKRLTRDFTSE